MDSLTALWIEAEHWPDGSWTPDDDVTEGIVTLGDGSRWIGTFCAFAHLPTLRANCAASGDNLGGKYLWASDLVLVDTTTRESIEAVVRDLLERGDLRSALSPVEEGSAPLH
jgi:hypothetical protein